MEHFRFVVDKGQAPLRGQVHVRQVAAFQSQPHTESCRRGLRACERPSRERAIYKVRPDDVVTDARPARHDSTIEAEDIPLDVVYEDEELMVINKAGKVWWASRSRKFSWHAHQCRGLAFAQSAFVRPNDPEVGLVHRIDKDTSGLFVIAKTPDAKTKLGVQFFNKTTHRSYNALVWCNLPKTKGA